MTEKTIEKYDEIILLLMCACNCNESILAELYCHLEPDICANYFSKIKPSSELIENMRQLCWSLLDTESGGNTYVEKEFCKYFDSKIMMRGSLKALRSAILGSTNNMISQPLNPQSSDMILGAIKNKLRSFQKMGVLNGRYEYTPKVTTNYYGVDNVDIDIRLIHPPEYIKVDFKVGKESAE